MLDDVRIHAGPIKQIVHAIIRSRRLVVFTGAGFYLQNGTVLTFRDSTGQWNCLGNKDYSSAEAFAANPAKVWRWYNEQKKNIEQMQPTPSHFSLVELENLMDHFWLITQTMDGLHHKAGSRNVVELHGNIWQTRCTRCDYAMNTENQTLDDDPRCPKCDSLLRPGVIWCGEPLPEEQFTLALEALNRCDLMINIGVNTEVQPASSLIWQAKSAGAVLAEISSKPSAVTAICDIQMRRFPGTVVPLIIEALKDTIQTASPKI
ncbi:MAG: NAD-dependent protein deacylase [Phycisphaerae bacterium]|jgi:NAD-dependent deacetylase|nr:NAD-dependent protein deacylase [Phycisphaerae bacterium]